MTRISESNAGDARRAHPHLHPIRRRRRLLLSRVRRSVVPYPAPVVGVTEPEVGLPLGSNQLKTTNMSNLVVVGFPGLGG